MTDVVYIRTKNRFLRFIEFVLSILLLLATNFFSFKFCRNRIYCYIVDVTLTVLLAIVLAFLLISLCLHMCGGRDSPCEIWFCLLGAVTNLVFAGIWLYMMLDVFASSNRIITVGVLSYTTNTSAHNRETVIYNLHITPFIWERFIKNRLYGHLDIGWVTLWCILLLVNYLGDSYKVIGVLNGIFFIIDFFISRDPPAPVGSV